MKLVGLLFLLPKISFSQSLDLGVEQADKVASPESLFPYARISLLIFSIYLLCGISLLVFFFIKKKKTWLPPVFLENFPVSAKGAITLGLISYCLVHVFALIEVFLVTKVSFKSTSEYFFYMKLPKLLATSHAHFFGHGTMYMATGLIFVFSKVSETWKVIFISIALSAGLLDVPSWWAIKYGGEEYELFSSLAGVMSVIGWGFMTLRIFYELWWTEVFGRNI